MIRFCFCFGAERSNINGNVCLQWLAVIRIWTWHRGPHSGSGKRARTNADTWPLRPEGNPLVKLYLLPWDMPDFSTDFLVYHCVLHSGIMILILLKATTRKSIALLCLAHVQCSALSRREGQGHKYSLYVCIMGDTHQLEVCIHCIEKRIYNICTLLLSQNHINKIFCFINRCLVKETQTVAQCSASVCY